jgi:Domain of unknown function (DUF4157)
MVFAQLTRDMQKKAHAVNNEFTRNPSFIHKTAKIGVQENGRSLPYLNKIQASFGSRHDLSQIKAYTGSQATTASRAMRAKAYATGNKIAFADANPDLHTVAHEAAHVMQQRTGVQLKNGIGEVEDRYEKQADKVANLVTQGKSVENLLDESRSKINSSINSRIQLNCCNTQVQFRAGIEYETFLQVHYSDNKFVEQDKVIMNSEQGWRIVSDNSKLEFVTEPPVPITELSTIASNMLAFIDGSQRILPQKKEALPMSMREFFANGTVPVPDNYVISPYRRKSVEGRPQFTVGVPFHKLFDFFEYLKGTNFKVNEAVANQLRGRLETANPSTEEDKLFVDRKRASFNIVMEKKGAPIFPEKSIEEIEGKIQGINELPEGKLRSFLYFIELYILWGIRRKHYPGYKKKLFMIMSRTSFRSMYENLNEEEKKQFKKYVTSFTEEKLALNFFGHPQYSVKEWIKSIINPKERTIPIDEKEYKTLYEKFLVENGINQEEIPEEHRNSISIPDQGLESDQPYLVRFEEGNDHPRKYYKVVKSDLMTAPLAYEDNNSTDSSMGAFKLNSLTDTDKDLVVVELRSLNYLNSGVGGYDTKSMRVLLEDIVTLGKALQISDI